MVDLLVSNGAVSTHDGDSRTPLIKVCPQSCHTLAHTSTHTHAKTYTS
jgi:hypothetical protein